MEPPTKYLMLLKWKADITGGGGTAATRSLQQISAGLQIVTSNAGATLNDVYLSQGHFDFAAFLTVDPDRYARLYRQDVRPTVDEIIGGIAYALAADVGVSTETLTIQPVDGQVFSVRQRCTTGLGQALDAVGAAGASPRGPTALPIAPRATEVHLRLGKLPTPPDPRTINLTQFVPEPLSDPPESVDNGAHITNWGLLGNDYTNDCAFAAQGHAEMLWAASAAEPLTLTVDEVLTAYAAAVGLDGALLAADPGADLLTALKFWQQNGIAGRRIDAFGELNRSDIKEIKRGIALFGCAYVGLGLPDAVKPARGTRPADVQQWVLEPTAGDPATRFRVDNGHCAIYSGYDARGPFAVSWGRKIHVSWEFHLAYCTELYAMLSPKWKEPDGLDMEALKGALDDISRT